MIINDTDFIWIQTGITGYYISYKHFSDLLLDKFGIHAGHSSISEMPNSSAAFTILPKCTLQTVFPWF
jgi:hypothetical protein